MGGGGGARLEYWGGGARGGPIPSRHMTSFRRHVPNRFFINQCQIITFLILKSDNIENSRIELKGIVLPVPSNQIKATFLLFYPSTWYICVFFLFHIEIEGLCGWIIGGAKGYVAPPTSQIIGEGEGGRPPAPPAPPLFLRLCTFASNRQMPFLESAGRRNYCKCENSEDSDQ